MVYLASAIRKINIWGNLMSRKKALKYLLVSSFVAAALSASNQSLANPSVDIRSDTCKEVRVYDSHTKINDSYYILKQVQHDS